MNLRCLILSAGRVDTAGRVCVVAQGGAERRVASYDVAAGDSYTWLRFTRSMTIPRDAVLVGFTTERLPTYACRNNHTDSHLFPGSVENNFCFIPFNNQVFRYENYELLTEPW
jgi:hypothetical protein